MRACHGRITLLLEQMVDHDVDLGVELTSKSMSAFTLMLREDHTRLLAATSALIHERQENMLCAQLNNYLMSGGKNTLYQMIINTNPLMVN